jgi:hypothetical protein
MSWGWTLAGTIAQLMLAFFLFMLVAFSAGGVANGATLSRFHMGILNLSLCVLPALCVFSALIVMYLHWHAAGAMSYWWYAMPVAGTVVYLAYVMILGHTSH